MYDEVRNYAWFVNEKAKTVTVVKEFDIAGESPAIKMLFNIFDEKHDFGASPVKCTGVAHCKAEDKFDVDAGKRIAYLKAKRSYIRYKQGLVKKAIELYKSSEAEAIKLDETLKVLEESLTKEIIK